MNVFVQMFLLCLCVLLYSENISAEDFFMTLDDSITVIIGSDHNWRYQNEGQTSHSIGKPISIDDGSTLVLKKDGTWQSLTEKENQANPVPPDLQSLDAVGSASRENADDARAQAQDAVYERLAKQFRAAIPKLAVTDAVLIDCFKKVNVNVQNRQQYTKNLWKATARIHIDEPKIRNIIECFQTKP